MRIVDIRVVAAAAVLLLAGAPGRAMVGDAEAVADARSRPEVMILGSGGTWSCDGPLHPIAAYSVSTRLGVMRGLDPRIHEASPRWKPYGCAG
jgi:hypothetical protein